MAARSAWAANARIVSALATLLIALGIGLRLYHVDGHVFWDDEVIATLHVIGVTEGEVVARAAQFHTLADLHAVVHPASPDRPLSATFDALRTEDPQHGPLYYALARGWVAMFGDSRGALRGLSAIIGLVALPCMYWLCRELLASRVAGWAGAGLIAVSPVAILYAKEVREYSLWLVAILVATTLFVRALARPSAGRWVAYGCAFALSLYVFPVSAFVGAAHATTLILGRTPRSTRWSGLAAVGGGFALFGPWLAVILTQVAQINRGMATIERSRTSVSTIARTFASVVRLDVLDVNATHSLVIGLLSLPILTVVGWALYALRWATSEVRLLVWSMVVWSTLPVVAPDLLLGGDRTANVRYFMPLFVAIDLALVALLLETVVAVRPPRFGRWVWATVLALLVVAKLGSSLLSARASTWWSDYDNGSIAVAAILDRASRPLVLGDDYVVWALSIAEYADPRIRVALNPRCYLCSSPRQAPPDLTLLVRPGAVGSVFLVAPSVALQRDVGAVLATRHPAPPSTCIDARRTCTGGLNLWAM